MIFLRFGGLITRAVLHRRAASGAQSVIEMAVSPHGALRIELTVRRTDDEDGNENAFLDGTKE